MPRNGENKGGFLMKLNVKRTVLVGLAFLSISAFWQMYDSIVPLILANNFQLDTTLTGMIMAADNVLALFLLPLFGGLSDKLNTPIGRRMPFILGGTALAVVMMNILPHLANSYFGSPAVGVLTGMLKIALIVIVVMLVLTQGYGKKGIVGKLMGIGGSLYNNITGYFSDILSYSRLMALMLAGAVIAQVFNTLGGITGNVITFFIISAIGNALNFALNLLGCYVHDMRLQCLEYFGRFYEDGGKPFRPVAIETKFVDIVK
jgi:vacuolar-type H+-ATPase subunit I/STV1